MKEAEMELMRTAKFPDNKGVPVSILANKQNVPGARNPKVLENLLGLCWLQQRRVFGEACTKNFNIQHPLSSATAAESIIGVIKKDDDESLNNIPITPTPINTMFLHNKTSKTVSYPAAIQQYREWYIQPTCAITGEDLQKDQEAFYEMILKRRNLNKTYKKTR
ncbi:unnamed protein product [Ceratitis capitata]|uniref:(Mediterranean fruit fly) hypothetical protein n=1 Tax=Ceratitis capitata TaxID=7213 RepID=A0A811USN2_CERCA|nr:unnamed protein product [Ceratitis capitata]